MLRIAPHVGNIHTFFFPGSVSQFQIQDQTQRPHLGNGKLNHVHSALGRLSVHTTDKSNLSSQSMKAGPPCFSRRPHLSFGAGHIWGRGATYASSKMRTKYKGHQFALKKPYVLNLYVYSGTSG